MYFALCDSDKSKILYIGHFSGTGNRVSSVLRPDVSEFLPEYDISAIFRAQTIPEKQSSCVHTKPGMNINKSGCVDAWDHTLPSPAR